MYRIPVRLTRQTSIGLCVKYGNSQEDDRTSKNGRKVEHTYKKKFTEMDAIPFVRDRYNPCYNHITALIRI